MNLYNKNIIFFYIACTSKLQKNCDIPYFFLVVSFCLLSMFIGGTVLISTIWGQVKNTFTASLNTPGHFNFRNCVSPTSKSQYDLNIVKTT